jgi:hypothetical protein
MPVQRDNPTWITIKYPLIGRLGRTKVNIAMQTPRTLPYLAPQATTPFHASPDVARSISHPIARLAQIRPHNNPTTPPYMPHREPLSRLTPLEMHSLFLKRPGPTPRRHSLSWHTPPFSRESQKKAMLYLFVIRTVCTH